MTGRALFLDRDGVLNVDKGYVHKLCDLQVYCDAAVLATLPALGFRLVVVTNQSGIGRGFFTIEDVERFNDALCGALATRGLMLRPTDFYVCPHTPEAGCDCRKPRPGLLLRAARELGLALSESHMVGDRASDMEAGTRAGATSWLLDRTGRSAGPQVIRTLDELVHRLKKPFKTP